MWAYEEIGTTSVKVQWGRIGLKPQEKTHDFGSPYERAAFIQDKINEKVKKGYAPQDEKQLKKDNEAARMLGTQYKVTQLEYVQNAQDGTFKVLQSYDPSKHMMVTVLNSWSKDSHVLLLSKNETKVANGVRRMRDTLTMNLEECNEKDAALSQSIREYLKKLAERIINVVRVKFGGLGQRKLMLDGSDADADADVAITSQQEDEVIEEMHETSVDRMVIKKFCALGHRKLEL
jgi:predicted DNA-binding WGR domain protein